MARLNIERQNKLQPTRMEKAVKEITNCGIKLEFQDETVIWFYWRGHRSNLLALFRLVIRTKY